VSEAPPTPLVAPETSTEIAEGVHVIPDERVEFVPNVGIVVGARAVLVIDTAMGAENGDRILRRAQELAGGRKLLLTTTHFHPEHAFGAAPIARHAAYVANEAQAHELAEKGAEYVEMFSGFGPHLAGLLEGVELVAPDVTYAGERAELDLGGIRVQLLYHGPAHTRGDQLVYLPDRDVLFTGDLVENRFLPIFPDGDASGGRWLDLLDRIDEVGAGTLVPGHGAVGDAGLVKELRAYLVAVRDRVAELHEHGRSRDEVASAVDEEMQARYGDWDNQMWIKSAAESFHAELAS
jgi:glyoxylase-like metal-dependent hydrolase (beta-lactamase superfamily II)